MAQVQRTVTVVALMLLGCLRPPTLTSITITPENPRVAAGESVQFAATGVYSDGSVKVMTGEVSWSVDDAVVAGADAASPGLVHAKVAGETRVRAWKDSVRAERAVVVTASSVRALQLFPPRPVAPVGLKVQVQLLAITTDDTVENVTARAAWTSSDPAVLAVKAGVLEGRSPGTATLTAYHQGVSRAVEVQVTAATVTAVQVEPTVVFLPAGLNRQLVASAVMSDFTLIDVTQTAEWTSTGPAVAFVNNLGAEKGLVSGRAAGTTSIRATVGSHHGEGAVTVLAATVTGVEVTPPAQSTAAGLRAAFAAAARLSDGTTQDITTQASWTSASPEVATSEGQGDFTGVAAGTTEVRAQVGTAGGTARLTVSPAVLAAIELDPPVVVLARGTGATVRATGRLSDGTTQDVSAQVVWATADEAVAEVSNAPGHLGEVLAVGTGSTTLTARIGAVSGSAAITVTPASLTSVQLTPATATLPAGTTLPLVLTGYFSDGSTQVLTAEATFASTHPAVATVTTAGTRGVVYAAAPGTTTVTASVDGRSASAAITVTDAALVSLAISPAAPRLAKGTEVALAAVGSFSDGSSRPLTSQVSWSVADPAVAQVSTAAHEAGRLRTVAVGSTTVTARLGAVSATAPVTVTAAELVAIEVSPAAATVPAGRTTALLAIGSYGDATTQDLTAQVSWSAASPAVATVSSTGVATGLVAGSTTVTARLGAVTGQATVTVSTAVLVSLTVSPPALGLTRASSGALEAWGTFSDGSSADVTGTVTWTSSAPAVATVSSGAALGGVVHAVEVGSATITATAGAISATASVTVTPAVLTTIEVTPGGAACPLGATVQLTATGRYSDGTARDLTATAGWSSSAPAVASVGSASPGSGLVRAVGEGSAVITATVGSISASATVTVTAAALAAIAITPASVTLAPGTIRALAATGTWTDGATADLTTQVTWSIAGPAVAAVSNAPGSAGRLAAGPSAGTTTVTATLSGVSGAAPVTVTSASLTAIDITPASPGRPAGYTQQLAATGRFSDGTTQPLTELVSWTSSAPDQASVSTAPGSPGLVTARAVGTPTISATALGRSGSVVFTVTAAELVSMELTPAAAVVPAGLVRGLTATGTFSDGTTASLTELATWTSSDVTRASVSNASGTRGQVTGLSTGTATITAVVGGTSATAAISVTPAELASIAVTPPSPSAPKGVPVSFVATGTYTDGSTQDVSGQASWASLTPSVAGISATGVATGRAVGVTTVRATVGSVSGATPFTVTPAELLSVGVSPVNPSVPLGRTARLTATGVYTDGSTQDLTALAVWTSAAPAVLTVSNAPGSEGELATVAQGSALVTATVMAIAGSTTVTVSPAVLQQIAVSPNAPTVPAGLTLPLTATGLYSDSTTQDLTTQVTWASSAPAVVAVSNGPGTRGRITGIAPGTAQVSASLDGVLGSVTVTVSPAVLQAIQVTPANTSVPRGVPVQLTATGVYSDGSAQNLTTQVSWASSNDAVVSVSSAAGSHGRAATLQVGAVSVSATLAGVTGTTPLTVTPAVLTGLSVTPAAIAAPLGTVRQLTATGTYTDGTTQNLTAQVSWASSSPLVVNVSNAAGSQGLATTLAVGSAVLTATTGSFSAAATISVNQAALASIDITPAGGTTALGYTRQFIAIGTYTDGTTQVLTTQVTWASSQAGVAFISNAAGFRGLLSTVATGVTTVSATLGGVTGSTGHTVSPAVLVSLVVSPPTATVPAAASAQLAATGTFSDGSSQDLSAAATWTSTAPAVAQVSSADPTRGLVTGIGPGTAVIIATVGSSSAAATITVP